MPAPPGHSQHIAFKQDCSRLAPGLGIENVVNRWRIFGA